MILFPTPKGGSLGIVRYTPQGTSEYTYADNYDASEGFTAIARITPTSSLSADEIFKVGATSTNGDGNLYLKAFSDDVVISDGQAEITEAYSASWPTDETNDITVQVKNSGANTTLVVYYNDTEKVNVDLSDGTAPDVEFSDGDSWDGALAKVFGDAEITLEGFAVGIGIHSPSSMRELVN